MAQHSIICMDTLFSITILVNSNIGYSVHRRYRIYRMLHEILTDATIVSRVYPSGRSLRFLVDTDDVVR